MFFVVDRLTKFAHFFPLAYPFLTSKVAQVFLSGVFKLHGMPISIVSNWYPIFTSSFYREIFKQHRTSLGFNYAYHPQLDGQIEVLNKCV